MNMPVYLLDALDTCDILDGAYENAADFKDIVSENWPRPPRAKDLPSN